MKNDDDIKNTDDELIPSGSRKPLAPVHPLPVPPESTAGGTVVVACSALKEIHRRSLLDGLPDVKLVYLCGDRSTLERRLAERKGHFFDPSLLDSQLDTLEEPANAIVVDIDAELETVAGAVAHATGLSRASGGHP